jgi:hypothetical protein
MMLRYIVSQLEKIVILETFLLNTFNVPLSSYYDYSYLDFCFTCKHLERILERQRKESEAKRKQDPGNHQTNFRRTNMSPFPK